MQRAAQWEEGASRLRRTLESCSRKLRCTKHGWQSPDAEGARKDPPPGPVEGAEPCDTLTSDVWCPELEENPFMLFEDPQSAVISYRTVL